MHPLLPRHHPLHRPYYRQLQQRYQPSHRVSLLSPLSIQFGRRLLIYPLPLYFPLARSGRQVIFGRDLQLPRQQMIAFNR